MTTNWLTRRSLPASVHDNQLVVVQEIVVQEIEVARDPLSRVFAALADPIRRDIVARLSEGDAPVSELAARHDVSKQAVAKHVRVLEDAGLVTRAGDAYRKPAHLEAEVFDLMTKWIERHRQRAEERYRRLDEVLAAMDDEPPLTHRESNRKDL